VRTRETRRGLRFFIDPALQIRCNISKTVRLLWRCARHSDHIATITTDIPFGDTEAHSATETPDGFADEPGSNRTSSGYAKPGKNRRRPDVDKTLSTVATCIGGSPARFVGVSTPRTT